MIVMTTASRCGDLRLDKNYLQSSKNSLKNFHELASKGWSTCSVGFDKLVEGQGKGSHSESKLLSRNSNLTPKTVPRKKDIRKPCHSFSKLQDNDLFQSSKENAHHALQINRSLSFSSSSSAFKCLDFSKNENGRKIRKSKNWTFTDLSNSFTVSPTSKKVPNSPLKRNGKLQDDDSVDIEVSDCSPLVNNQNVVEKSNEESKRNSQNGDSDEIGVICSKSPQLTQESKETKLIKKESNCGKVTEKNLFTRFHQNLTGNFEDNGTPKSQNVFRGSEWLKSLEWNKRPVQEHNNHVEEKAHVPKYNKFISGGLAEHAARLEKRERSSRLIWSHKKSEKSKNRVSKCLTVKIGPLRPTYGMMLSKCLILKNPVPSENSSPQQSSLAESVEKNLMSGKEYCFLLLKTSVIKEFKCGVGSTVTLYPPWQSLDVQSLPYPVILCAYFIDILETPTPLEKSKPVNYVMEEILFFNNYNSSESKESSVSFQSPISRKVFPKPRKRLWKGSTGLDIRKYLKPQQQLDSHVIENAQALDEGKCRVSIQRNNSKEAMQHNCDLNESLLESYSISSAAFSLRARVQRIWQHASANHRFKRRSTSKNLIRSSDIRYSLLVQDENFHFFELQLLEFGSMSENDSWSELLHNGEGCCFMFDAVKISRKLNPSKYPTLFSIFTYIREKQQNAKSQTSATHQVLCYQLTANCSRSSAVSISDDMYPPYCTYEMSSLTAMITASPLLSRLSCYAKVLCEFNSVFYVTDKSVQQQAYCPYIKMSFCSSAIPPSSLCPGSEILITEAVVQKDLLFVDKYSTVVPLSLLRSDNIAPFIKKPLMSAEFTKGLFPLSITDYCWKTIHHSSEVGDLVKVEGKILSVDANSAISWLECNVCAKEDLYQDENCKIFCNLCSHVVECPKLNMKMNINVQVCQLPNTTVFIELSCLTTKRILEVPNGIIQPKCNVKDVLYKRTGPLVCLIRNQERLKDEVKFELYEIMFS